MTQPAADMLIIADDLSGAADCGIACTLAGLDTVVLLDAGGNAAGADAVAIDADTRRKTPAQAAADTACIVRAWAAPGQILFKKLDSTLRGHIGPELAAILTTRRQLHGAGLAVMAPAFPAAGRTTAGGHQLLHGVPLEQTDVWRRERVDGTAHIPTMLAAAGLRSTAIQLDTVRDGPRLRAALAHAAAVDVIVCDAEQDTDLRAIAEASLQLGRNTVWVGSAGLAHHLPAAADLTRPRKSASVPPAAGPILFVVGSASPVSREQAAQLSRAGVETVTVAPSVLRAGATPGAHDALARALATRHDTVVLLAEEGYVDLAEGLQLSHALGALVAPFAGQIGALVCTGGETARAVLERLGASGLRLVGEVAVGVPFSIMTGGRALPVITKAGAFGQPDTLLRCRAALRSGWGADN